MCKRVDNPTLAPSGHQKWSFKVAFESSQHPLYGDVRV